MRRALRLLTVTLLWMALPLLAAAQGDGTLQRHTVALENLSASVNQLGSDNLASLDALESAASTMRLVARDTASSSLVTAMEQVFDNARQAITNQSRTDLAVQVAVLRGGFQRALLESSLASGSVADALPGVNQLASELGLDGETLDALAASSSLDQLLGNYRAGLARNMAARLDVMQSQFVDSQEAAYVTLAAAYGMSLSLQDAPQTPASLNSDFATLISAVVQGDAADVAAYAPQLGQVLTELGSVSPQTAETAPDAATETPATAEPTEAAGTEPAQTTPEELPVVAQQPESQSSETTPQPAVDEPQESVTEEAADTELQPAEPTVEPAALDLQEIRAELLAEQEQLEIDMLVNDLGRRGLRGQAGENLASQLHSRGINSVAELLGSSLELTARASDAVSRGNQAAGQQYLSQLQSLYQFNLAPLTSRADPAADSAIRDLLTSLQGSPAVRVVELQSLSSLLSGMGGSSGSTIVDTMQATSASWTSGWPRLALLIVAALLTILPLTFLRLAFGGGNRNWSLIGAGLFLLLLPVILGGVAAVLEIVGKLASLPLLLQMAAWFTLDGALQQLLLLLLVLLATVLLATGLYGICKQFGLFGGESGGRRLFRSTRNEGKTETRTLVDWDEEF